MSTTHAQFDEYGRDEAAIRAALGLPFGYVARGRQPAPEAWLAADEASEAAEAAAATPRRSVSAPVAPLTPRQRWDAACCYWEAAELFPEGSPARRDLRSLGNRELGLGDEPAPARRRGLWRRIAIAIGGRSAAIEDVGLEGPAL